MLGGKVKTIAVSTQAEVPPPPLMIYLQICMKTLPVNLSLPGGQMAGIKNDADRRFQMQAVAAIPPSPCASREGTNMLLPGGLRLERKRK